MPNPTVEWSFDESSGDVLNTGTAGSNSFTMTGNTQRTAAGGGYTSLSGGTNSKGLTQSAADNQNGPASLTDFNVSARSMMFWIKFGAASTCWAGELRRTTEDTGVYGVLNLSDAPRFRAKDSSNNVYERTFAKDAGNWHHIAATHDGTTLKVYRDGAQVGADISMPVAVWTATGFRVLDQSGSGTVIDHFRYFNSVLSSTDINTWMNTNSPYSAGGATDLVIQDATIPMSSDVPTLVQQHTLVVNDATLGMSSDNSVLSQIITLAINKATMAMTSDTFSLPQVHNIAIHEAFLTLRSTVVSLAPPGTGGFMSVSDVQVQKLRVLTGKPVGTIQDLMHAYYGGLSGLVPAAQYSVTDHQRKYWETQTGVTSKSMADLEKAFYDQQLIAAGSLADREFTYWTNLP